MNTNSMNTNPDISNDARAERISSRDIKRVDEQDERNGGEERATSPFDASTASHADEQWQHILTEFVDDPHGAVTDAHELVSHSVQSLIDGLNSERAALEGQWKQGKDVSTETLRICLQRYRSFFNRLLSRAADEAATNHEPPEGTPPSWHSA
jgi:hypothetical protein